MENNVKIKIDRYGNCKEFTIDGVPLGKRISKLEVVVEPDSPTKIIMELFQEVDIECEKAKIKQ